MNKTTNDLIRLKSPVTALVAAMVAFAAQMATAATFYVATNGNDGANGSSETPFATIAAGVSAALASSAPRKVVVRTGTYKIDSPIQISDALTIASESGNRDDVVIDGQGLTPLVWWTANAPSTTLSGLTLKNGFCGTGNTGEKTAGIYMRGGTVTNCVIRDCLLSGGGSVGAYGAGIYSTKGTTIVDCHIIGNVASNYCASSMVSCRGGGVFFDGSGGTIRKCTVENCMTWVYGSAKTANYHSMGGGVCADSDGAVTKILDCTISDCVATNISVGTQAGFAGCGGGIAVINTTYGAIISNCLVRCNFASYNGGGIYAGGPSRITHCTVTNNHVVALSTTSIMGGGGVALSGTSSLANSRVEGNTVSGGTTVTKQGGGGAVYTGGTNNRVTDCLIAGNSASRGGGIVFQESNGSVVSNCFIYGNKASANGGAVAHNMPNGALVVDCLVVSNCVSTANGASGSVCKGESTASNKGMTFRNCFIYGNYFVNGGNYVFDGQLANSSSQPFTVEYCTIVSNNASYYLFGTGSSTGSYVSNYFCRGNVIFGNFATTGSTPKPVGISDARGNMASTTNAWYNFTDGGIYMTYGDEYGNRDTLTSEYFANVAACDYRLVRGCAAQDMGGPVQPWMEGRKRMDMGDGTMTVTYGPGYGVGIMRNNTVRRLKNLPEPGCFELWFPRGVAIGFK